MRGEIVIFSGFCYKKKFVVRKNDEDESANNENDFIMEQDITYVHTDVSID